MAKCIIPHLVGKAAGDEGAKEDGDDLAWVRVASKCVGTAGNNSQQAQEQQRSKSK